MPCHICNVICCIQINSRPLRRRNTTIDCSIWSRNNHIACIINNSDETFRKTADVVGGGPSRG